eukprot:maker-scaffold_14-snap-gene-3.20-mRNA-1 protein AED:0.00 eAED:0.00 QI:17/1/1/1/1/1/3/48/193
MLNFSVQNMDKEKQKKNYFLSSFFESIQKLVQLFLLLLVIKWLYKQNISHPPRTSDEDDIRVFFPDVSQNSFFKYVLIQEIDTQEFFVQGCPKVNLDCTHPKAFRAFQREHPSKFVRVLGGGRIYFTTGKTRKISIFGFSKTFSKRLGNSYFVKSNEITCQIIAQEFFGVDVRWSPNGYSPSDFYDIKNWKHC